MNTFFAQEVSSGSSSGLAGRAMFVKVRAKSRWGTSWGILKGAPGKKRDGGESLKSRG